MCNILTAIILPGSKNNYYSNKLSRSHHRHATPCASHRCSFPVTHVCMRKILRDYFDGFGPVLLSFSFYPPPTVFLKDSLFSTSAMYLTTLGNAVTLTLKNN